MIYDDGPVGLTDEELNALEEEALEAVDSVALSYANRLPSRSRWRLALIRLADLPARPRGGISS